MKLLIAHTGQGERSVRIQKAPPPPPFQALKSTRLSASYDFGTTAGTVGAEEFFLCIGHGVKMVFRPMCAHSKCSEYIGDFKSSAEFASFEHFPLLWCQLTRVLTCSPPLPFLAFRLLLLQILSTLFLMPPKKAKQVVHTEYACQRGAALLNATNAFWLGAVRESGHLGRIPNCLEVPDPPPPPTHAPLGPPPPPALPPAPSGPPKVLNTVGCLILE